MMDNFDIKAELVLSVAGQTPEAIQTDCDGRFRRGYVADLMEYDSHGNVRLVRPGIRHLVPEGLFFDEEFLRDASSDKEEQKQRTEQQEYQKHLWRTFFKPYDTILFRQGYRFHLQAYECERNSDIVLASMLTGVDLDKERDPYVRLLACLLLNSSLKGNVNMLGFYVGSILKERVEIVSLKVAPDSEHKSVLCTTIRFTMIVEGLTTAEYRKRMDLYEPFFNYLQLWFLPFDCDCEYAIKDRSQAFVLGDSLTLDYNTQL